MRTRGAKRGANDQTTRATSSYLQPLSLRQNGTSGHTQHLAGTLRKCLLSSRSRVRVAVGAQVTSGARTPEHACHGAMTRAVRHVPRTTLATPVPCELIGTADPGPR